MKNVKNRGSALILGLLVLAPSYVFSVHYIQVFREITIPAEERVDIISGLMKAIKEEDQSAIRRYRLKLVKAEKVQNIDDVIEEFDMTPLMFASFKGNAQVVRLLLEKGADRNKVDKIGRTALIYASMIGRPKVVEILLAKGADPNKQDSDGKTALMYAAQEGLENIVRILLKNRADKRIKDNYGKNAFDYARTSAIKGLL